MSRITGIDSFESGFSEFIATQVLQTTSHIVEKLLFVKRTHLLFRRFPPRPSEQRSKSESSSQAMVLMVL